MEPSVINNIQAEENTKVKFTLEGLPESGEIDELFNLYNKRATESGFKFISNIF